MKFLLSIVLAALSLPCLVHAAFGYKDDGKNYVIGMCFAFLMYFHC